MTHEGDVRFVVSFILGSFGLFVGAGSMLLAAKAWLEAKKTSKNLKSYLTNIKVYEHSIYESTKKYKKIIKENLKNISYINKDTSADKIRGEIKREFMLYERKIDKQWRRTNVDSHFLLHLLIGDFHNDIDIGRRTNKYAKLIEEKLKYFELLENKLNNKRKQVLFGKVLLYDKEDDFFVCHEGIDLFPKRRIITQKWNGSELGAEYFITEIPEGPEKLFKHPLGLGEFIEKNKEPIEKWTYFDLNKIK